MTNTKSRTSEKIILVDPNDKKIGFIDKIMAHQYGMLHRAYSVIILRRNQGKVQVLLQQRASTKYHGGGLWSNTCCSHPHPGEKLIKAAENRLLFEMGINVRLRAIGKFHYIAQLDSGMTENEIDHVLIGQFDHDVVPINTQEVESYKWINIGKLKEDLVLNPKGYTPWLAQALELALRHYPLKD